MSFFFSVDWGTSSFRLRLVKIIQKDIQILQEITESKGIAKVYEDWNMSKETDRVKFYMDILNTHINELKQISNEDLAGIPIIVSGMATSSIGIKELKYAALPFSLDGDTLNYETIEATPDFNHELILISGVKSSNDVMRGEEVQLLGCRSNGHKNRSTTYIFPGTHSKHIQVKNSLAIAFKTYMTGELFHLLTSHSILKNSITKTTTTHESAFKKGVRYSRNSNLLESLFSVRTNDILKSIDKDENYSFLSGLLIGFELQELTKSADKFVLCGHSNLSANYELALQELSLIDRTVVLSANEVDKTVVLGHLKVLHISILN